MDLVFHLSQQVNQNVYNTERDIQRTKDERDQFFTEALRESNRKDSRHEKRNSKDVEDAPHKENTSTSDRQVVTKDKVGTVSEADMLINPFETLQTQDGYTDNVYNIQELLANIQGQITLSLEDGQNLTLNLSEQQKMALLDYLKGTPLNSQVTVAADGKSAFSDTEATLDERALFAKILQNLTQGDTIKIPTEALIAAGISPDQLTQATVKSTAPSLGQPTSTDDFSEELVALLGLVQNLPQQSTMQKLGGTDGGAWTLSSDDLLASLNSDSNNGMITMQQLKAAIAQLQQGGESQVPTSKAAQIMNNAANENNSGMSVPILMMTTADGLQEWFDPLSQERTATPGLPSAMTGQNATSVITQTQPAHAPHPASQIVAVSLQKNANANQKNNWTIQLDPPELGKVEVHMSFGKDKSVKTHMIVEKPETLMMLQRDAQLLQNTLQQNSANGAASGMSFELANEGFDFSGNGSHDGQNGHQGRGGDQGEDEIQIIETTMNWHVDPETGLQRYDLKV